MQNIEFDVFFTEGDLFVSEFIINKIKKYKKYTNIEETKAEESVVKNE